LKEIGREINSKDGKYRTKKSNQVQNNLVDYNIEFFGNNTRRSTCNVNDIKINKRKFKRNNTISECSTQTELGDESAWSRFMKIFQCGR
jgi:hypothetical protein